MKNLVWKIKVAIVVVVVLVAVWISGSYLAVQTDDGIIFGEKEHFHYDAFYVDTRDWGAMDYIDNPEVSNILLAHGYTEIEKYLDGQWNELGLQLEKVSDDLKELLRE